MKKIKFLVHDEQEFMGIFDSEEDFNFIEVHLGIEFAFEDGTYQSDICDDNNIDESQDIRRDLYKKRDDALFPSTYPCLVIYNHGNVDDHVISFKENSVDVLLFIYPEDFER